MLRHRAHRILAAAALLVALAVPAIALAGHPAPGATYLGKSDESDRVVLKVNDSGGHMFVKVTDPCGNTLQGGGLTIGKKGRFDAVSSAGSEVKGVFDGRRKATGTIRNKCKHLGSRPFVAHKQ